MLDYTRRHAVACQEARRGGCEGPVEFRSPAPRRMFPRCEAHQAERLAENAKIHQTWPEGFALRVSPHMGVSAQPEGESL